MEDSPVDELNAVGRSMVRGVATKADARSFSATGASATAPAGLLNGTLPGTTGDIDIASLVTGVGAVAAAGGNATVIWAHPDDITVLRLEVMTGVFATSGDPESTGIERLAVARLIITPALTPGTDIVADPRFVLLVVRRDARVDFSGRQRLLA